MIEEYPIEYTVQKLTKRERGKSSAGMPGWLIQFAYDKSFVDELKDTIPYSDREWDSENRVWWISERYEGAIKFLFEPYTHTELRISPKPIKCQKCNDTGLVPSTALGKFSGKPIPHCYQPCECQEAHEYYPRLKPSDLDFPMSYDFYRGLCQEHGWQDPGSDYPEEIEPSEVIHRHFHSDLSQKQNDGINQLILRVKYLDKKVNKIFEKKKGKVYNKYSS